ncbi:hypothetical protein B0T17DRAFT_496414 [Bombardia bombarda]|uniref:DUF7603 domain-containing protein n=1 Tax=Bombardia bombarda TaxID=252184 RepID=A0AA39WME3_9PEZI|nr:hypothetical protein B0T17DRAFT_496414 [Bombardia bombarda]
MAALDSTPERARHHNHSISPLSDTSSASSEVAVLPRSPQSPEPPRRPVPLALGPSSSSEKVETSDQTLSSAFSFATLPPKLAKQAIPSQRTGRSQSLAQSSGPIKRKPLSATASPLATRYSSRDYYLDIARQFPRPEQRFSRSFSLDSPTLYEFPDHRSLFAAALLNSAHSPASSIGSPPSSPVAREFVQPKLPIAIAEESHLRNISGHSPAGAQTADALAREEDLSAQALSLTASRNSRYGEVENSHIGSPVEPQDKRSTVTSSGTMSMFMRKSPPPHLTLGSVDADERAATLLGVTTENHNLNKPLPKSPGSANHGTFFGWPSPSTATEFSDKGFSPLPSPYSLKQATLATDTDESPVSAKSSTYSNDADDGALHYLEYLQTPPANSSPSGQIQEMEDELKAISAELASSIRREMDLEDLVDRLQEQVNYPQAPGRRTSDYFSDSGYSSAKFSEYDHSKDEFSLLQRRAEQEKAQITLELTGKLQDERSRRKQLDKQIMELSRKASQIDMVKMNNMDAGERIKELENTCDDLRRKLSEERQDKDNFQDLLAALKGELQSASNERDNLRDEVIPQLRSRVEGLEADAAENAKLAYDASKLQQEIQALKSENTELKQVDNRLAELKQPTARAMTGLSRSASVAGGSYKKARPQTLSRSNTTRQAEPREALAERLKDVEAQRDALHSALKNLLERQELQNRENSKKIRLLETERDRLLSGSPKKAGYEREVTILRDEISVLRRRAEEAIEQKWEVEKGLGGLKMDLDRAEEEISSLRSLLKEKDILIPETLARSSRGSEKFAVPATSESLEKAYKDLQAAYIEALSRIRNLENNTASDEKTRLAMEHLERSLSAAVSERELARNEATSYLNQLESLRASEEEHFHTERDLADQLRDSARRVEELAQQVRAQLDTNASLRSRLSDTVARGEANQRVSTERITGLQNRLRTLEEQVVAAQTNAEERVTRHEEELATLKESHNIHLQRLSDASGGLRSPRLFPPKSPLSPMFSMKSGASGRSPRMSSPLLSPHVGRPGIWRSSTTPLNGASGSMAEQVETLKGRVAELEGALAAADAEMQEVVSRMNTAQIEVLTLQEEREDAVRQTRRLQRMIDEERVRVFENRFRTITTEVR